MKDILERFLTSAGKDKVLAISKSLDDYKMVGSKMYIGKECAQAKTTRVKSLIRQPYCVACGIKGDHWKIEQTPGNGNHVNLYGYKEVNGKKYEVMLTWDHILPKSKGGDDSLENAQTLCHVCNYAKMSDEISLKEIKERNESYWKGEHLYFEKWNSEDKK
jgi:5-methylcytosine-specific restriction endonuclease McrA